MPQQQQGFGGGYQPSRQRFNQMPQQQGFGGGYGMPQQQGFGNTFARTMPPQQGFGGKQTYDQFMQQRNPMYGGDTPMAPQQRDPMRPMVSFPAPQQDFNQPSATPAPSADMNAAMDSYRQQANQMMQPALGQPGGSLAVQDAALRSMGMPTSNEIDYTDPRRSMSILTAQPPKQQPQAQTNQPPASMEDLASALRGMDPRVLQPNVNRSLSQPQMPSNPYAQQIRQEDPRMQAMRMMQRMRFGGGGGYDF
jgi:hypothetical protein